MENTDFVTIGDDLFLRACQFEKGSDFPNNNSYPTNARLGDYLISNFNNLNAKVKYKSY